MAAGDELEETSSDQGTTSAKECERPRHVVPDPRSVLKVREELAHVDLIGFVGVGHLDDEGVGARSTDVRRRAERRLAPRSEP